MVNKFNTEDIKVVLHELEKIQKTKLAQIKPSKKLFKDENGMIYLIFGGRENWHGISKSIVEELNNFLGDGVIIIAKKYQSRIDVCAGSLSILMKDLYNLPKTKSKGYQFHTVLTEDGMYIEEIEDLYLNKICEIHYPGYTKNLERLKQISKIINIEIENDNEVTHSDIQAKLLLIGSYLNYRTYTPDRSKNSIYGLLGDLCTETVIPEDYIPPKQIDTIKYIDVIWFDEEGFPTHAFEVEHSTDITKGLLRLYQVHKLKCI